MEETLQKNSIFDWQSLKVTTSILELLLIC